jgi:small conductance mechanosensitive channel
MKFVFAYLVVLTLALCLPGQAGAQAVAIHQAVKATTPASPAPSTIIPGSPLAAITGVGAPAPQSSDNTAPSPFGTSALGLSVTDVISHEATGTVLEFVSAVKKSTALTPVWQWLQSFPGDTERQQHARQILEGLATTVLPALVLETLLRLSFTRPRAALVRRAARLRQNGDVLPPETAGLAAAEAGELEARSSRRYTVFALFHRLLLALLHLGLCLLPVLAFGLAAGALLGFGYVTSRQAHLSVVGVSNAYLFCRIVLEAERFLTAPWTAPLRLLQMQDGHALWLNRWLRILLITGGFSYGIVSICEILNLPHAGAMAVTRILVLAVHIELAIMIWKSRKIVAGWIRGKPDPESLIAGGRRAVSLAWHYLALFYVMALWVAWAGGVQNAFGVLLRVVLFFVAAILFGRLAWYGSEYALERLFPDPKKRKLRHPNFVSRARTYTPLIRTVLRIIIGIAVVAVILLGWRVNIVPWLLQDKFSRSVISAFIAIVITIAIALIIWEIASGWLDGQMDRLSAAGKTRQALRLRTTAPILKATLGTAIGLVAGLICLSKIGVNAAPLLAGAGVLGIAIGFGSQKLVQDIITGLFLLMEDTMQVGDVVTLAGMSGTVERLSIRTIRLRGGDGSVNIIPFSAVTTVTNQTRDFGYAQISIGVGYTENVDHVCAVLTDIARTMRSEATWGSMMRDDLQINGLDQFGSNALIITGQIRTGPGQHWAVRREFSRRVVLRFAEEKIEIPYSNSVTTLTVDPAEFNGLLERLRPESADKDKQASASFSAEKEAKRLL